MSILREIGKELFAMFWADGLLTPATLALIAIVAVLVLGLGTAPTVGGSLLVVGCIAILVGSVKGAARAPR